MSSSVEFTKPDAYKNVNATTTKTTTNQVPSTYKKYTNDISPIKPTSNIEKVCDFISTHNQYPYF